MGWFIRQNLAPVAQLGALDPLGGDGLTVAAKPGAAIP